MSLFIGEFTGTALLIILGDGVVANVLLNKTKGNNGGLIAITFGWAIAVFIVVFTAISLGGKAHLNPAVTIAFAAIGKIEWSLVATLIVAQMLGAMSGALIVWVTYRQHFEETNDAAVQLAVFCNAPAIRSTPNNLLTEITGTFVLIFAALNIAAPASSMGALNAIPVAFIVLGIGLSLGGPTGYAINPARDLGPRIMHFILPIKGKGNSDWRYSWIPVVGPIIGGLIAAYLFNAIA